MTAHAGDSRRQGRRARALLLVGIVAALIGGVIGGLIVHATESNPRTTTLLPSTSGTQPTAAVCDAAQVADDDLPSVVTISSQGSDGSGSTGSGEIIDHNGDILTNNHVISNAASGGKISVLFSDGQSAPATLVGRDPQTDLAVIRATTSHPMPPIPLGSSESLEVGQPVVALGAPLGLSNTVTTGIVSALGRSIEVAGESDKKALLIGAIQTDAAINPGNSGGSLVNCSGQLVGIPSAGATVPGESGTSSVGSVGLGFAIPVDLAKAISSEIIATGKVVHSYFGISAAAVDEAAAASAGLPEGLYVSQVDPSGPGAQAGLKAGDVITSIAGQKAVASEQLTAITLTDKPGTKVKLDYSRQGTAATATVTLAAQP